MTTVPQLRPHTTAVATLLGSVLSGQSPPVPLGIGRKPENATSDWWAVLYPLAPDFDGPVGDYAADLTYPFQVTSVGTTVEQAEWVADLCRGVLLGAPLTISGRTADLTMPTGGTPVQRDDDITPPVFYRADTYTVYTSPA